jgi:hypothetical protein
MVALAAQPRRRGNTAGAQKSFSSNQELKYLYGCFWNRKNGANRAEDEREFAATSAD